MKKKKLRKHEVGLPFIKKGLTLIELIIVIGVITVIVPLVIFTINSFGITNNTALQKRKADVNAIADTYIEKALSANAYLPLESTDYIYGKIPIDTGFYQGLLTEKGEQFTICTPLDPKNKEINCLDVSNNDKCYCRKSSAKGSVSNSDDINNSANSSNTGNNSSPQPVVVPSSNPSTSPSSPPAGTVPIYDDFNRDNSNTSLSQTKTGQEWISVHGTWGIIDNTAYPVSITGWGWPTITYAVVDSGNADGIIEVTLSSNKQDARIPFRLIDESNNYFVERNGWGYHIEKTVDGQRIELTPRIRNAVFVDSDRVKIELDGPSIKLYLNNELLLNVSDSAISGTKHGIGTYFDKSMRFDNFKYQYPVPKN